MSGSYRLGSLALLAALFGSAAGATTITIVNLDATMPPDGPEGFNDPTIINEADGFPVGTTLGAKRMAVFQAAAAKWASIINSNIEIRVGANFDPETCTTFSAQLGQAGPNFTAHDFTNAPRANTDYPIALAEAIKNAALISGTDQQISAQFNSAIDDGCFGGGKWWYATDIVAHPNPGNHVNLFPVVLHELGHGLGFVSFACVDTDNTGLPIDCPVIGGPPIPAGGYFARPDVWSFNQFDATIGMTWSAMTNAQRAVSIINDPNVVWNGANVVNGLPTFAPTNAGTSGGFMRLYDPASVEPGSSVSHWTKAATSPDLLMEPVLSAGLFSGTDLTDCLFKDIGWSVTSCSFAGVNQAPSVTASASIGVTEDVQSNLTGISFSDPDAASGSLTAIFTVASGALNSPTCTGIGVSGSAAARTLQGTLANLNACLAGNNLKFTTAQDATTSVLLSISINDNGNTGSGGAKMGMGSSMLTVSAVNDAPSIAAPGSIQVTEDAASNVTGISFADVDAGAGSLTATFGVGSGSLNSPACTGVTAGGTATARTLAGTLTNLNACLGGNNLKFTTASNTTTSVTLNVQLNDNGNTGSGGAKAATPVNVMLNVTAVNDAPTLNAITDPAPIPVSSGLQTINLSGISAGPNESQTLTVSAGSSNTGLIPNPSVTYISPNATGSIAYTPVAGQTGSAMVTVTVMDNGGTANGGVNQTSRVFNVSVGLIVNNIFSNGFETPTP